MSNVTNAILLTGNCHDETEPNVVKLNEMLADHHGYKGRHFVKVDEHAGGPKLMECSVYIAAFNYLDHDFLKEAIEGMKWTWPLEVQLLLKGEDEDQFQEFPLKIQGPP